MVYWRGKWFRRKSGLMDCCISGKGKLCAYGHVLDTVRMVENSFTGLLQVREFPEVTFTVRRRTSCINSSLLYFSYLKRSFKSNFHFCFKLNTSHFETHKKYCYFASQKSNLAQHALDNYSKWGHFRLFWLPIGKALIGVV